MKLKPRRTFIQEPAFALVKTQMKKTPEFDGYASKSLQKQFF